MPSLDPTVLRGYRLGAEIAVDERFCLRRARRQRDGAAVLLKLALASPTPEADVAALQREHELLANLPIDAVTRALELWQEDGRWVLVLDDEGGGRTLAALAAKSRPQLGWVLDYAIQIVAALAELHRCGVVHRGLQPRAVLVEGPAGRIRLTDFSEAARDAAEAALPLSPRLYGSRLAYAAPEQTGRVSRGCDDRTDFYALGVLLYELLTGQPPFRSDDAHELIHAHLAKLPPAPCDLQPAIPLPVSQIVMKLLAKSPEERYQSASCLERDLQRCRRDWSRQGRVLPFEIAQNDVSERFAVPQRLYGRETELSVLRRAFEQARAGEPRLLLVSGYAGVGKTALIRELQDPVAASGGHFVAGKFDQLSRDVPYGALIQALRQLVQRLLTEPTARLERHRSRLQQALGVNAALIAELIPELRIVLGEQPPAPWLPEAQARNRFTLAFQNFIAALATADHPLAIFLDDLQWVDSATLQLLGSLLAGPDIRYLLLLGAYRDNEVDGAHPLAVALSAIEAAGVPVRRIALRPLELPALGRLTADTLHVDTEAAFPLAALLLTKTDGNPFFVTQFLLALHQEGLIEFDAGRACWRCRLERVADAAMTDNVVELMSRKIDRLAPATQRVITLAACIGNRFDLPTLCAVSEQSCEATLSDLAEATLEGLVVPEAPQAFSFLHDRVQQAAYARIADGTRPQVHLAVGRLLLAKWVRERVDEGLFDVASHLNIGAGLIAERPERLEVARLDLVAGRKARSASAHRAALGYFGAGLGLLDEPAWLSEYELAFELHLEAAQCEYLCGDFDAAERAIARLLPRASTALDRARVHGLRMVQAENLARYGDALSSAREGLALFGVALPQAQADKQQALDREMAAIDALLAERPIESLIELPAMADAGMRMVMGLLTGIWSSAYLLGDALLARLISAMLVRLSLEHGNAEESAYGYVTHAITLGPVREDYAAAYAFGRLALAVNERFDDRQRRAKIYQQFHAHVNLWRQPMSSCIAYAREACRSGLESGDFLYAAYAASTESWPAIVSCQDLPSCVRQLEPNLALLARLRNAPFADALRLVIAWARALQGETAAPRSLSHAGSGADDGFDEQRYADTHRDSPFFAMLHSIARLQLGYLLDAHDEAWAAARSVRATAHQLVGMIWSVLFDFWNGLTIAARLPHAAGAGERDAWLAELQAARRSLAVLASSCPANFRCHALLLDAECERVCERPHAALELYEQAIASADEAADVQQQALAHELYGLYWLGRGNRGIAALYLRQAAQHYARWGAHAKVRALGERHRTLFGADGLDAAGAVAPSGRASPGTNLDLSSVVRAAHAIAEPIDLDELLERLLKIAIEQAGARRGVLVEVQDGELVLAAEGGADSGDVALLRGRPLADGEPRCARAVVHYVHRTRSTLVLADASRDDRFAQDPWIVATGCRSILCLPIAHQGGLTAILYLEHDLARDAFDPRRVELLGILLAQAAISLGNAQLAFRMRQEMTERQRAEDTLRAIEAGTASAIGGDFFRALVRNLARALHVRHAFVAECGVAANGRPTARTRAFWRHDHFGPDFEYELPGTPCHAVVDGETCHHVASVQSLFPADRALRTWGAQSYLGMPLVGSAGEVIGHMAIVDTRPMPEASVAISVLRLSAGRAAAELERLKAAEGLQRALAEVERLKDRLQEENVYLRRELIANVSHDLRSPLASLRGYLETLLIKEAVLAPAERRAFLEIAARQAEHLQTLISELFELAKLDFQGYRINPEPLHPGELAQDVMQKFMLGAQQRGIALQTEIDPDVGFVRADIALLERTLANLLDNALAHTPAGGAVRLSVHRRGARVTLRVGDTGSGIPAADLPRIFERFYRVDKARSRHASGSGLGLAIVKRIVELHGSEIRVESRVDSGTAFWFDLPAEPVPAADAVAAADPLASRAA